MSERSPLVLSLRATLAEYPISWCNVLAVNVELRTSHRLYALSLSPNPDRMSEMVGVFILTDSSPSPSCVSCALASLMSSVVYYSRSTWNRRPAAVLGIHLTLRRKDEAEQ
ncbi:hypothetical protein AcW1_004267 [Taiwanofungus camphoratus]|nr:hypothetical protein AcW2_006722 [Antrodia cinnamomea]KAI0952071.1 hypothetical protein AcV7_007990 [Antrodia cinnamomea]KAI0959448.1 hypothetical protein AcW1_004267 [Antrodia cinnamomea]